MKNIHICGYSRTGSSLLVWLVRRHEDAVTVVAENNVVFRLRELINNFYPSETEKHRTNFIEKIILSYKYGAERILNEPIRNYDQAADWWATKNLADLRDRAVSHEANRGDPLALIHAVKSEIIRSAGKTIWCEKLNPRGVPGDYFVSKQHKFLLAVRDPRAVIASQKVKQRAKQNTRTTLSTIARFKYYIRKQKHIYDGSAGNALWVRYEDVKEQTANELDRISEFIGTDLGLVDLASLPNNSSYTLSPEHREKNDLDSSERWKSELTQLEISAIERLCYKEIKYFGYNYAN